MNKEPYVMIEDSSNYSFARKVCDHLRNGYELYGPPFATGNYMYQALVLPKVVDKSC